MMTSNRKIDPKYVWAAALAAIPLIYFYPVLLGRVVLAPGDGWAQNFAVRVLTGNMMAAGGAPLWNPLIFAGMPLAASVYPGSFYPPNWVFAFLPPSLAMNLVVLTTYHLALVGTYLYGRRLGMVRVAALLAGIGFAFGGYMINHLSHTSRIAAAAWLPWVLLAIENLAGAVDWRGAWRWTALGALFIALQYLAGEPQMLVFTALTALPCAVYAFLRIADRQARSRFAVSILVMGAAAILISLVQLLPSIELLGQSERSDPGPAFFDTFSFPPWQLPALIVPYFFGGAMFGPYKVPYWGRDLAAIMAGYVGMLVWLPGMIAVLRARTNPRIMLWLGIAIVSLLLAFGGYLPFGINHLLYRIPGYGTFRGLYRHQFELTFALGMLGGLGLTALVEAERRVAARLLSVASLIMAGLMAFAVVLYGFFGERLASGAPSRSLGNPEILVPVGFLLISMAAIWLAWRASFRGFALLLLPALLLLDVASYGHFFHWRIANFDVSERLADPPAVRLIKSREKDLDSFRIMSHITLPYDYAYAWPEDINYRLVNEPNISMLRGLQSVSGYDVLRPVRVGQMTGSAGSALLGFVQDQRSFDLTDRGLDLLNVRYLLVGRGGSTLKQTGYRYDGIDFALSNFGIEFKPGTILITEPGNVEADSIAFVTTLANSAHLPDGAPVLKLKLHTSDGRVIEHELQAGRDVSEWAWDRPDVRAIVKHKRARVVEDREETGFKAHSYLSKLGFERARIERIEWTYAREDASLYMIRASLHDSTSGKSHQLSSYAFPSDRWEKLDTFDMVDLYRNRTALPRAWFVEKLMNVSAEQSLAAVRSGVLPDGSKFDPQTIGLVEEPPSGKAYSKGEVTLRSHSPNEIEFDVRPAKDAFLVVSEVFYPGWEVEIDGNPGRIERVDYTLRGIEVPAGARKVRMIYRPRSWRRGLAGLASGILLLAAFWSATARRRFRSPA
ncbi:MAG: hypothetical protein AB7H86_22610 [Blastocatellales bacterium]